MGRNTLARGVELVADWLRLTTVAMLREQIASGYMQLDETPVKYLAPGCGKTKTGYFWVSHVPGGDTVYHWAPGRGYEHLRVWLPDTFDCMIQTDDYKAYGTLNLSPEIRYALITRIRHPRVEEVGLDALTDPWREWPGVQRVVGQAASPRC